MEKENLVIFRFAKQKTLDILLVHGQISPISLGDPKYPPFSTTNSLLPFPYTTLPFTLIDKNQSHCNTPNILVFIRAHLTPNLSDAGISPNRPCPFSSHFLWNLMSSILTSPFYISSFSLT